MVFGAGAPDGILADSDARDVIDRGTPAGLYLGKRVLVLTPDATRTCPLPMMVRAIGEVIGRRCKRLDFMVALGTHAPLPREAILRLYGIQERDEILANSTLYNHEWQDESIYRRIGHFDADEIEELSEGMLREEVPIIINGKVFDYDLILITGPVFPHEVVGFSGGAKYLFPGISGGEFLHFFHWLGAIITCRKVIGIKDTPVRGLIHRALEKLPVAVHCLAMVVTDDCKLAGLHAGDVREAWSEAADLSARIHIVDKSRSFDTVLGRAPLMYDELWTAGKVMYKLEQVVAPGGTLIIYGPHIREVSRAWGQFIERVGYHTRDYLLERMDRLRDIPRGVLAHLTHVKGTGACHCGIEEPDVKVVLATSIPRDVCERINLGYMDPHSISIPEYMGREDEGILFVDRAGETLYRLAEGTAPA